MSFSYFTQSAKPYKLDATSYHKRCNKALPTGRAKRVSTARPANGTRDRMAWRVDRVPAQFPVGTSGPGVAGSGLTSY